jgi:hypothetical protein
MILLLVVIAGVLLFHFYGCGRLGAFLASTALGAQLVLDL